jgi:CRP/FNR family cyclic AMP-dependent transcriptional regulator
MSENANPQRVRTSSLGAELYEDEAKILAGIMGVRHLKDGELLIAEGGAEHTLFVLIEGKLAVIGNNDGKETVLYTMAEGESAGTRAFIDRTPRKATLRALGATTVYTLTPDAFETLLDSHPRIVYKVMRALFRVTHTNLMRVNQESQALANYITKSHGRY